MLIENAIRTIEREVKFLRETNDRLAERVAELEDLEPQEQKARERQHQADLRRAYRRGYLAGYRTRERGQAANPTPEATARGALGRAIRTKAAA